ncbi:MAG: hypothetical protein AB7G13_05905 [Lautropia sp.]
MKFEILHDVEDIEVCRLKRNEIRKRIRKQATAAEQAIDYLPNDRALLGHGVDERAGIIYSLEEEAAALAAGKRVWRLLARGTASLTVSLGRLLVEHRRIDMSLTFCPAANELRFNWIDPANRGGFAAVSLEGSTVTSVEWGDATPEARRALHSVCEAVGFSASSSGADE